MMIKPIVSALRRHKAGTILIALQIALTLAIVCNALFIIHQRVSHLSRGTGIDESNLVIVTNRLVGNTENFVPLVKSDLQALRQMPDVASVYATNSYPLRNGGWSMGARTNPDQKKSTGQTAIYFVDEHALATLGAKLIAGRNFNAGDVIDQDPKKSIAGPVAMVTKALADKLFPDGSALGKNIYLTEEKKPTTIVGIVEKTQVPWVSSFAQTWDQYVTFLPAVLNTDYNAYMVRAKPGQEANVRAHVLDVLVKNNRMRTLPDENGVQTFADVRRKAYERDRGMAIMMGIVCAVLLAITAAGIVGLTSFWVGQRRKQIGVRRALGATKRDILTYFLTENFLIGGVGVIAGSAMAIGMSMWLQQHFETERMSVVYVAVGVVLLLLLGQGAVLAPAMRASKVSPVEATRNA